MVVVLAWYMQHLARQIARLQEVVSSFVWWSQIAVRIAGDSKLLAGQCPQAAGYPAPQHDSSSCMHIGLYACVL
jgi:hypothetical protein